jgi:VWFA-related protein
MNALGARCRVLGAGARAWCWVLGAASALLAAPQDPARAPDPAPQQAYRSTTEAVLVDVLVTRNHRPVEGLTAADFHVRDSGVLQKVTLLALDTMPVDLRLVLDVSGSLHGTQLAYLKSAARAAVQSLGRDDRAELLTFSDDIRLRAKSSASRNTILAEIDKVTAAGWTSLVDATFTAVSLPDQAGRRTLALVFTDGQDTSSWLSPADVVRMLAQSRVTVYGVMATPVGSSYTSMGTTRLRELLLAEPAALRAAFLPVVVADSGGELMYAAADVNLQSSFLDVLSRFNRRYVLSYTPTGVPKEGWHPIDLQVKDKSLQVTGRRGYTR